MGVKKDILNSGYSDYNAVYGWQKKLGQNTINFGYINSFKEAADDLVEKLCPDLYIFPIMFCYRQYLELILKNIYFVNAKDEDYNDFLRKVSHDLLKIWSYVKPILAKDHSDSEVDLIDNVVCLIHEIDPKSYTFRYPKDKKQNDSIQSDLTINTKNLKKYIDKVDDILRYTYDS